VDLMFSSVQFTIFIFDLARAHSLHTHVHTHTDLYFQRDNRRVLYANSVLGLSYLAACQLEHAQWDVT
jgi:hypothetical protein